MEFHLSIKASLKPNFYQLTQRLLISYLQNELVFRFNLKLVSVQMCKKLDLICSFYSLMDLKHI